jgi:general stress protein YciG
MPSNNQQGGRDQQGSSNRGFASMDDDKQREIAAEGGRAAHEKGTAHEFDSREAREAGRKGGEAVSRDREHMADIGRQGGESRGGESRGGSSNSDGGRQGGGNR